MKLKRLLFVLLFMGSCFTYAQEPGVVSAPVAGGVLAAYTTITENINHMGGAVDHNKSCSCRCSAEGILLLECGDETENLGNYGNIENCNIYKESNPQCN